VESRDHYDQLMRIAGDKIVAYRGRNARSLQPVLLHQLSGANDHTEVLKLAIRYLLKTPAPAGKIVDLVELRGTLYVVTVDDPECLALREWLDWELSGTKSPPEPEPEPEPAAPEPGEFSRLFSQSPLKPAARVPDQRPPAPVPAAPQSEFSRLFNTSPLNSGSNSASVPPPWQPESSPVEPAASLPSSVPQRSEFSRIFGRNTPATPDPLLAPKPTQPPSAPDPLTENLEPWSPVHMPPPPPPQSAPRVQSEFSRILKAPPAPAAAVSLQMPTISPPSMPSAPSIPSAPSVPSIPSVPTPPPATVTVSRPPGAMIILFVVLLVLAIALVAFVAMRHSH
jgi:hypothetical protein